MSPSKMSPNIKSITMLTVLLLLIATAPVAIGQSQSLEPAAIDVDLAQFVADQHISKYYSGFDWRIVDHKTLYDIDGSVNAYAFIFAVADSDINSSDDLQRYIQEKSVILEQAKKDYTSSESEPQAADQAKALVEEAEEALYNFRNFATVITGARTDTKMILRHHRGLPEFWVRSEAPDDKIALLEPSESQQIIRVIMITPMDIRLVVTEADGAKPLSSNLRSSQKGVFSESDQIVEAISGKAQSIAEMKKMRRAIEDRKQRRLNTLEPERRTRYEQALQDRAKALAGKWQNYREMWLNSQENKEVTR